MGKGKPEINNTFKGAKKEEEDHVVLKASEPFDDDSIVATGESTVQ